MRIFSTIFLEKTAWEPKVSAERRLRIAEFGDPNVAAGFTGLAPSTRFLHGQTGIRFVQKGEDGFFMKSLLRRPIF